MRSGHPLTDGLAVGAGRGTSSAIVRSGLARLTLVWLFIERITRVPSLIGIPIGTRPHLYYVSIHHLAWGLGEFSPPRSKKWNLIYHW